MSLRTFFGLGNIGGGRAEDYRAAAAALASGSGEGQRKTCSAAHLLRPDHAGFLRRQNGNRGLSLVSLSDSRLLSFNGESVELAYKDYRDGGQHKTMTLTGEELVRRFLLHVLPKGFMRVRHFGFLANRCRARRLSEIRVAIEAPSPQAPAAKAETAPFDGYPCPKCRKGRMQVTAHLAPQQRDPGGATRSPP